VLSPRWPAWYHYNRYHATAKSIIKTFTLQHQVAGAEASLPIAVLFLVLAAVLGYMSVPEKEAAAAPAPSPTPAKPTKVVLAAVKPVQAVTKEPAAALPPAPKKEESLTRTADASKLVAAPERLPIISTLLEWVAAGKMLAFFAFQHKVITITSTIIIIIISISIVRDASLNCGVHPR
jgi:hypothetical protein